MVRAVMVRTSHFVFFFPGATALGVIHGEDGPNG